jgi:glyoxylase-like metal-dependent hydrolase (beta-lactamase superfamily II)/8-oxo-dGTP pyrophosphatase MutT (NUDIX family)
MPKAPAAPRAAATTLVVRERDGALEVLMLRRSLQASFMPGAYVFPGGAVDAADADAADRCDETASQVASRLAGATLADAVAALRECFEECGLWLGTQHAIDAQRLAEARPKLHAGATAAEVSRLLDEPLRTSALWPFSHWVTPIDLPKRFDARFFVALEPHGQEPSVDEGETTTLVWVRPQAALDGAIDVEFATASQLRVLAKLGSLDALLAYVRSSRAIEPVHPRVALDAAGKRRILVTADHAYAEVQRLDPHGGAGVCCDIVPGRAVRLSLRVQRLTAPNAGMMTGPGTNSYLVGDDAGYVVVDPGPPMAEHVDALMTATGGRIAAILVTHTHRDHSPGAALLAARSGAPCFGLPAPLGARQDESFVPSRRPADDEVLRFGDVELRAIHTPGHASNHVCWWFDEERMLFTGDHLMQGSTVVIDPPDGDMGAYLASLRALPARLPALQWLAPGHGFLVARPFDAIAHLVKHRLAREAKVLAAFERAGRVADGAALLPLVYDDVPAALHPVATRSLLAHLVKLRDDGVVVQRGHDRWERTGS